MKTCNTCSTSQPLSNFYTQKTKKDGLYNTCKTCTLVKRKARYKDNPDKYKAYSKAYRLANLEAYKARKKAYRLANLDMGRAWEAKRRASKIQATPPWLTKAHGKAIQIVYSLARECEVLTGDKYHVDHVVPLQGDNVCGLHVPWNLQVLPSDLNLSKSNSYPSWDEQGRYAIPIAP
jgi:hypothetical protein